MSGGAAIRVRIGAEPVRGEGLLPRLAAVRHYRPARESSGSAPGAFRFRAEGRSAPKGSRNEYARL